MALVTVRFTASGWSSPSPSPSQSTAQVYAPPAAGVSVTVKVPSGAVVTPASVSVVPSGRRRVTVSGFAPAAAPAGSSRRPVSVSGWFTTPPDGGVSVSAEAGKVMSSTRHKWSLLEEAVFTAKTSVPENARRSVPPATARLSSAWIVAPATASYITRSAPSPCPTTTYAPSGLIATDEEEPSTV
ncbi:hypothetical protein AB0392_15380 [Nonomuraea angiospora]|uniref:hypothetical protein n=1 Tax=Nonomuraea angiospora TaxID=46172 RepID=UPI00344E5F80